MIETWATEIANTLRRTPDNEETNDHDARPRPARRRHLAVRGRREGHHHNHHEGQEEQEGEDAEEDRRHQHREEELVPLEPVLKTARRGARRWASGALFCSW